MCVCVCVCHRNQVAEDLGGERKRLVSFGGYCVCVLTGHALVFLRKSWGANLERKIAVRLKARHVTVTCQYLRRGTIVCPDRVVLMFSYSLLYGPEVFATRSGDVGTRGRRGPEKQTVGKREEKFPDNRPFNRLRRIDGLTNETESTGARGGGPSTKYIRLKRTNVIIYEKSCQVLSVQPARVSKTRDKRRYI